MAYTSMPLPGVSQLESITDWENMFAAMSVSGVVAGVLAGLAPSLDTSGRNAVIGTGNAVLRGFLFENTSATSTPIPAPSSQARIDRLVLRLNRSASTVETFIVPTVVTGTPAANPQEPALTQTTTGLWDLPVFSWTSAASGALTGLTDERFSGAATLSGLSSARPSMSGPGLLVETDTSRLALWAGGSWQYVATPGPWQSLGGIGLPGWTFDRARWRLAPDGLSTEFDFHGYSSSNVGGQTGTFGQVIPKAQRPQVTLPYPLGIDATTTNIGNFWPCVTVNPSGVVYLQVPPTNGTGGTQVGGNFTMHP